MTSETLTNAYSGNDWLPDASLYTNIYFIYIKCHVKIM